MKKIASPDQLSKDGVALLYVGTSWCKHCARTKPAVEAFAAAHPEADVAMIDGDDEPDVLMAIGAKTYPQILLYRDGQKIAQRESADQDTLTAWLAEQGVA